MRAAVGFAVVALLLFRPLNCLPQLHNAGVGGGRPQSRGARLHIYKIYSHYVEHHGKEICLRTKIAANGTSCGRLFFGGAKFCVLGSWGGLIPDPLPCWFSNGPQVPLLTEARSLHVVEMRRTSATHALKH